MRNASRALADAVLRRGRIVATPACPGSRSRELQGLRGFQFLPARGLGQVEMRSPYSIDASLACRASDFLSTEAFSETRADLDGSHSKEGYTKRWRSRNTGANGISIAQKSRRPNGCGRASASCRI